MHGMERWKGRVALVTGASSGIGRSCAAALARRGMCVAICARREEPLDALGAPHGSGVYSATKFAVRSLTEGLRKELRDLDSDIRIAAISPGFVETGFARVWGGSQEAARETYERYPCIQPEEIADALLYLLRQPPHVEVHDILMRPTRQPY